MENRIREAFQPVRADEALLQSTAQFLRRERERRNRIGAGFLFRRTAAAVAAASLLVATGISGYRWYWKPTAYVSIDVNPSVELALNRTDRVADASAFNQEGEQILGTASLRKMDSREAVELFLSAAQAQGYLGDGSLVSLSVQAPAEREAGLGGELLKTVEGQLESGRIAAEAEVLPVSRQVWEEAHQCHMSPAKYLAIQELMEVDAEATLEELSHHSIQGIRSRTEACREGHASGSGEDGRMEKGHGHGRHRR